ncbi:hypothetical protein M9458_044322, partial [Cirrhinus mrigala]
QDTSLMGSMCDIRGGVYSEPSTSFPLDGPSMSLNGLANLQSSAFSFPAPISQSADAKHGHTPATLAPQKLTLEKYREKHAELEQRRRHEEEETDQHRKHGHLSVKYSQQQIPERSLKSGSLKRRHPSSQEELKMKIKVSSESSGSSKSRHSPRSGREKHREHSSHKAARHDHHHHHHHSSKSHRSSKSHSSSASIAVNQPIGHAQLAKIDRRLGEGQ